MFHQPPSIERLDLGLVMNQCESFNCAYRSYWPLIEDGRAVLARSEDLLVDCRPTLREIQARFHLGTRDQSYVIFPKYSHLASGSRSRPPISRSMLHVST
jgi:hypothetical protein